MRAKLTIELTDADGALLARRSAHNAVMRGGANLIARLFAGTGSPITHLGVGISDTPETEARIASLAEQLGQSPGALLRLAVRIGLTQLGGPAREEVRREVEPQDHAD